MQNAKEKREKRKRKIEKDEESSSSSESETEGETKKAKQKETKEEKEAGDKEVSVVKKAEAKPKIDIWKKRYQYRKQRFIINWLQFWWIRNSFARRLEIQNIPYLITLDGKPNTYEP